MFVCRFLDFELLLLYIKFLIFSPSISRSFEFYFGCNLKTKRLFFLYRLIKHLLSTISIISANCVSTALSGELISSLILLTNISSLFSSWLLDNLFFHYNIFNMAVNAIIYHLVYNTFTFLTFPNLTMFIYSFCWPEIANVLFVVFKIHNLIRIFSRRINSTYKHRNYNFTSYFTLLSSVLWKMQRMVNKNYVSQIKYPIMKNENLK